MAKKIECGITGNGSELVWSLDGKTIAISLEVSRTLTVHTYEVTSGAIQSSGIIQSTHGTHIWAHNESFQVLAITGDTLKGWMIDIFDVKSILTKIKSFTFQSPAFGAFSPGTYRISASSNYEKKLLILGVQSSEVLLQEIGQYWNHYFSPDGSVFAAVARDHLLIWRYTSGHYTHWRKFQQAPMTFQFSPTLSSILGHAGSLLSVLHLDCSPTAPTMESAITINTQPLDAFSPNGAYIATTHYQENIIRITNLHSKNPSTSQLINAGFEILAIVLTGNVLLVKGSNTLVAWLLTEEGVVDGIHDNRRANHNNCLWEISVQAHASFWTRLLQREGSDNDTHNVLGFSVEGEIAAISCDERTIHVYHTKTGEILPMDKKPLSTGYCFHHPLRDECNNYHRTLHKHHQPLECDWPVSQTALQGGWVKDLKGKHRLWLHPHWRSSQNDVDWFNDTTTLRLRNRSLLVLVKF